MANEIFQLKPNIHGLGIDLRALGRWFQRRSDLSVQARSQAERFLKLFRAHGLQVGHIPRLTSLGYRDLKDDDALLSAITPELIDTTAGLFGVRSEWLGGIDDAVYQGNYCYKSPHRLLELVDSLTERASPAIRVVTTAKALDMKARLSQRLELVVVELVETLGETEVLRYHPFTDGWDWCEPVCRIQLKAMMRAIGGTAPLYQVSHKEIEDWYNCSGFPASLLRGPLITNPSLEDYSLYRNESCVSKESSELPLVEQYMEEHSLRKGMLCRQ